MSDILCHRPMGTEVIIAESGFGLGNTDPRFGTAGEVKENRGALRAALGVSRLGGGFDDPRVVYAMVPNGGDKFVDVDTSLEGVHDSKDPKEIKLAGDALITHRQNVGLFLGAADCIPLVMHDPRKNVLSLTHLGWSGATLRLHEKVLGYTATQFGSNPSDVRAYLGPSISSEHYIKETLSDEHTADPEWGPFTKELDDGFHIDIPGFVVASLVRYGLHRDRIGVSQQDTGSPNGQHFSYTRHKKEGTQNGRNGLVALQRPHSLTW